MLESPATAIIPKSERIQIKTNTTAICLKGLGRAQQAKSKPRNKYIPNGYKESIESKKSYMKHTERSISGQPKEKKYN